MTQPTAPRKRGPKGTEGLKQEIRDLKAEVAVLRPQIMKRECDYENRREMLHSERVRQLESELASVHKALTKSKSIARHHQQASDSTSAQLAAARLEFEERLEASERAAKKELGIALAAKLRMISLRDAKVAHLLESVKEVELRAQQSQEEAETERERLELLNSERLWRRSNAYVVGWEAGRW